jgi:cyanate permease
MGSASIGGIVGPTLAGWVFDTTADYRIMWFALCGLSLATTALIARIRPLRQMGLS